MEADSVNVSLENLSEIRLVHDKCAEQRNQQLAKSRNIMECRRLPSGTMKYAVGMVVKITPLDMTGVVVSWEMSCKKSDDWIEENGIRNLARGSDQPFYRVLVIHDFLVNQCYLAEGNLIKFFF